MLHRPTAEAVYSIRTRLFDAIAAGVPVITTEEGYAAELVRRERLGLVVPRLDRSAVVAAIRRLLQEEDAPQAVASRPSSVSKEQDKLLQGLARDDANRLLGLLSAGTGPVPAADNRVTLRDAGDGTFRT